MQKVDAKRKKKKNSWKPWLIGAGCVLCFLAGIGIPVAAYKTGFLYRTAAGGEEEKFKQVYNLLKDNWYYAKDEEDFDTRLMEQAIMGMSALEEDRHTSYFNLEEAEAFSKSLAGSNVGIGISFHQNEDGNVVVRQVYINSTADKAGIEPGDIILEIGQKKTSGLSSEDLVSYIKSFEGKKLDLVIERNGEEKKLSVTPGTFDSTVSARMMDGTGVLTLSSFSADSGKDFTDAIGRLQKEGAKDLILDLRDNTGGYLSSAAQIASSFLPDDTVIFVENLRDGTQKKLMTDKSYAQIEFDHIYILQNENTASASEVLIGALKDHMPDKVTTIGTNTYGKGTEQVTIPFEDGTSLKYTMAEWTTPSGISINKTGFAPDVEIEEGEVAGVTYRALGEEEELSIEPDTVEGNAAAVQVYLRALGYPAERSDAYFSQGGSEALRQFQSDQNLEPTGIVDRETFERLIEVTGKWLAEDPSDPALDMALALSRQEISLEDALKNSSKEPDSDREDSESEEENSEEETQEETADGQAG